MEPYHEATPKSSQPPVKRSLLPETSPRKLAPKTKNRPKSLALDPEMAREMMAQSFYLQDPSPHSLSPKMSRAKSMAAISKKRQSPTKSKALTPGRSKQFKSETFLQTNPRLSLDGHQQEVRRKAKDYERRMSENALYYPSAKHIDNELYMNSDSE